MQSAAPTPPLASFDGTYTGTVQVTAIAQGASALRQLCTTTPRFNVTVIDNAFMYAQPHPNYPGQPVVTYTVVISPTGIVTGSSDRNGAVDGRIEDGVLTATINGSGCFYAISARRA